MWSGSEIRPEPTRPTILRLRSEPRCGVARKTTRLHERQRLEEEVPPQLFEDPVRGR